MSVDATVFPADPRALTLEQRRACRDRMQAAQRSWLGRLQHLCEVPPADDFPAFLLATPPMRDLAQRLGAYQQRRDLPTGLADEVDRFVEVFADYLRTCAGEDSFVPLPRRAG